MRIRWTRPAAGDLTQICDYIENMRAPLSPVALRFPFTNTSAHWRSFPSADEQAAGRIPASLSSRAYPTLPSTASAKMKWRFSEFCTVRKSGRE